jgi:hypothetical protein
MKRVSARVLQQMFNSQHYWDKVKQGILVAEVKSNRHPSSPKAHEPFCTRSQYIIYRDKSGRKIAGVHQYLRPDGTIGASGRPDPKQLFFEGTLYIVEN